MSGTKPLIYLADLTHTGQIVASNVVPLGIGVIASYLKLHVGLEVEIELFKYPHDLDAALQRRIPKLIGFANYSWNLELAYAFAQQIKKTSPQTVIVFGGPNYGLTPEEVEEFWRRYPMIDFYVVKEGEVAFANLFEMLYANGYNAQALKNLPMPPSNCHFLKDGKVVQGEILPRIKSLEELGSPYLLGLMDKFFDGVLIPMIHTTRGCPFTCAFCTEGNLYYSKVAQRYDLRDELTYIAKHRKSVQDLAITDANFGMYKEDEEKAKLLTEIQHKYDWPKRIIVSTGKNQKERIIQVASTLNGAISIAASLQSTDETVLSNIKRSNISSEALRVIVEKSTAVDTPTYTEIILGLPGDSIQTHTKSLRDVLTAGLGIVRMYQLILLPQTEINTPEFRRKYDMKTKFRINPRSFGSYPILKTKTCAIESEEICVQNNTMSYDDYFSCRELDLTVEILHNTGMFVELMGLCQWLDYSWFDLIYDFYQNRRSYSKDLTALYNRFTSDSQKRLWNSRKELEEHVRINMEAYLNDPYGTNEMAVSKAIAFFNLQDELHEILFSMIEEILVSKDRLDDYTKTYIEELKEYSKLRKKAFIDTSIDYSTQFHFDFTKVKAAAFKIDPKEHYEPTPSEVRFFHSPEQKKMINAYILQYGKTVDGLGRILMRAPVKTLFRDIQVSRTHVPGLSMESFG